MKIQESAENYLETILVLSQAHPYVRSIDIANEMGFSKPSVSVAMKNLRTSGHIQVDEDGHITLTESGRKIAEQIYERHTVFSNWLMELGVDRETALRPLKNTLTKRNNMYEKTRTCKKRAINTRFLFLCQCRQPSFRMAAFLFGFHTAVPGY